MLSKKRILDSDFRPSYEEACQLQVYYDKYKVPRVIRLGIRVIR